MKTVKKPTKAHKGKKVIKAHEGMAHVPRPTQGKTARGPIVPPTKLTRRPTAPAFARDAMSKAQEKMIKRGPLAPTVGTINAMQRDLITKERATQDEIRKRMRGNKVASDAYTEVNRRADAEIKRRGGMKSLEEEYKNSTYVKTRGRKGKRPERLDPFKGMSSRERRRLKNAGQSEYDEINRQVRKQMGTQRKPRQPIPKSVYTDTLKGPQVLGRNKGGAVKKKYAEVKTLKQGGYVSRAKYGSTNNLKK